MEHPSRFHQLVAEAKRKITEISPDDAMREVDSGEATLIDVRSADDWDAEHAHGAKHLERDDRAVALRDVANL